MLEPRRSADSEASPAVNATLRSNALPPSQAIVVLGPLPLYAAKPYAWLPAEAGAVEYLPYPNAFRWLRAMSEPLPAQWGLRRASLPMLPGFRRLAPVLPSLARLRLPAELRHARAVVITSPFQDALCALFPGTPMLYHVFDDYTSYGWTSELIGAREARILARDPHVVVVSDALARLYRDKHRVPSTRITVVPNGYDEAPSQAIPAELAPRTAPRLGTLGNVNVRLQMDWVLEILEALPWATWTFVGAVTDDGPPASRDALAVLRQHPRCAMVGPKPYAELSAYAAAFDVAVFPFSDHTMNRASSPTRFFSQIPFGQPILATRECEQLAVLHPLVTLCDSPAEFIEVLSSLRRTNFRDGRETARFEYAKGCTWQARAAQLGAVLDVVAPATNVPGAAGHYHG